MDAVSNLFCVSHGAKTWARALLLCAVAFGCHPRTGAEHAASIDGSEQLVVVTTPRWESTSGTLERFERQSVGAQWSRVGARIPIVVGRTGIAWGVGFDEVSANGPEKHEGDGKAPAGIFPLDTLFGFAPPDSADVKLPYTQLVPTSDCVDDTASLHYNTVVRRDRVPSIDWNSAEHMRSVQQYEVGVIVGYNANPPVRGRGSCIFLHIWAGPASHTAGCTAMEESALRDIIAWLDGRRRPLLVQLTADDYHALASRWHLPAL